MGARDIPDNLGRRIRHSSRKLELRNYRRYPQWRERATHWAGFEEPEGRLELWRYKLGELGPFVESPRKRQVVGAIVRREFQRHSKLWREETMFSSSLTDMFSHPSYLRIIGLGREALPLVLLSLKKEGLWWFAALRAMSGESPDEGANMGDLQQLRDIWLKWGRENGLLA